MLFEELGKMKRDRIMSSIVMIAVGLIMIMIPVNYIGPLVSVMGYALLIGSAALILDYFESKKALMNYIYLTGAIAIGLVGMYVLVVRSDILLLLRLLFGLWLSVDGVYSLYSAVTFARRAGSKVWGTLLLLSLIETAEGVILLLSPWWYTPAEIKPVIGIMLLASSVISIIRVMLTWPIKNV